MAAGIAQRCSSIPSSLGQGVWTLAALLLLGLWLTAGTLVWRLAILPNLDNSRHGLALEVFAGEETSGPVLTSRLAGPADLTLEHPQTSLRARGVWLVPRSGEYSLRLTCDDHGGLSLDRRQLIVIHGSSPSQTGHYRLRLEQGGHLLEVVLHNREGRGWARLEIAPPGTDDYLPLPSEQLYPLSLGNLETWLGLTRLLEEGGLVGLAGLLGAWIWFTAQGVSPSGNSPWLRRLGGALAFLAFALLWRQELAWAVGRALTRDEHQFIASAVLLAREGLLPYADFPYFHAPYLAGIYALVFPHVVSPLVAARAISALFALGCLGLVFWGALRALAAWPLAWRGGLALGLTLLMSQEDLFRFTSGLAWNHDVSTFLALASLLLWPDRPDCRRQRLAAAASGLTLAVAVGVRLSYAPLALAFLCAALARPWDRWRAAGSWVAGAALGSLPFLALLLWQPARAIFGNLGYPLLNTQFHGGQGLTARLAMVWREQILWPDLGWGGLLSPARFDALILILLAAALAGWLAALIRRTPGSGRPLLAWGCLPLLLVGALSPNPLQMQYLYPLIPFSLLVLVHTWGLAPPGRLGRPALLVLFLYLAGALAWSAHASPPALASQSPWRAPAQVHRLGQQLAALAPPGRVLTLTPVLALEGGLSIYPSLAASPFSWRVAPLMSPQDRARQGMIGPQELASLFAQHPPSAILLGWEKKDYEVPIKALANSLGLRETPLAPGLSMWSKPEDG